MTIGSHWSNWQLPAVDRHGTCSPNLLLVLADVQRRFPGTTNLGCYGARPIRGGGAPSSHSYGAAVDIGYPADMDDLVAAQLCPFLVGRSEELRLGAVHDYRRCRIWHAGRTSDPDEACTSWWKAQRPSAATGMGQVWANHLHVEVTAAGWGDSRPVLERWDEPSL